ncbi:Uncharacterised protein [Corynebacterium renale]|uniref:hypothetical protein n=1 Tax=Corynebacterium renale TaxID=1724 RepID=UPI000DA33E71|nr:hypothetical protein [Corynebacterium renale]SQG63664.1 Uncharacterised protein [Corynebacterium renale]STD01449.1 Uncharacterised protein [Corynebacterium renale]
MIWKADIANVLKAYDPSVTQEQIDNLYDTMYTQWSQLCDQLADTELKAFRTKYGQEPGYMETVSIRQMGALRAKNQVYGAYLEGMNQEIAQRQIEEDEWDEEQYRLEQEARKLEKSKKVLMRPNGWKEDRDKIVVGELTEYYRESLWPDGSLLFDEFLEALLERIQFLNEPLPETQKDPEWLWITQQVNQAVTEELPKLQPIVEELTKKKEAGTIKSREKTELIMSQIRLKENFNRRYSEIPGDNELL